MAEMMTVGWFADAAGMAALAMGSVALWTVRVALAARGRKFAGGVAAVEALVFALAFTHLAAALDAPERGVATGSGSPPARSSVSSPTNDSTRSRSEVRAVVPAPIWPWSTTSTRPAGRSPGAVPADRTAPSRCCSSRSMIVGRRTSSPSCVSCARRRSSRFTVSVRCTLLRPHRSPRRRTAARCPSTPSAHERTGGGRCDRRESSSGWRRQSDRTRPVMPIRRAARSATAGPASWRSRSRPSSTAMAASASDRRRARAADELRRPHDPGLDQLGDQRAEGLRPVAARPPASKNSANTGSASDRPRTGHGGAEVRRGRRWALTTRGPTSLGARRPSRTAPHQSDRPWSGSSTRRSDR